VGAFNGTVGSIFYTEVIGEYRRSNHAFAWRDIAGFIDSGAPVAFGSGSGAYCGDTSGYHIHTGADPDFCAENFHYTSGSGFSWELDVQHPEGIYGRAIPEDTGYGSLANAGG